jgi:hypothetical protein
MMISSMISNCIMILNLFVSAVFLLIYVSNIDNTKLMNFPMITSTHDFRDLRADQLNVSIQQAGCHLDNLEPFYLPEHEILDPTSATC